MDIRLDIGFDTDYDIGFDIGFDVSHNGAMSTSTFSGDRSDSKPVTMETSVVEAGFGGKGLGISGTIMAAAFLPKCT
jgi:hypothetical protein